jgi:hypothetical protein
MLLREALSCAALSTGFAGKNPTAKTTTDERNMMIAILRMIKS